jgi:ATP-binding protein involved in chromosome partitioning
MQVAASDALRGLKMFEKLEVPILGVVENMSGEIFGTGAGEKLASDYDTEFLGSVPMDANVRVGGDSGQPMVVAFPDSPAARAFEEIAQKVAARVSVLTLQKSTNFIPIELVG